MKEFLKKHWWEPVLLLAAAALCFLWMNGTFRESGDTARLTLEGKTVMEVPLDKDGIYSLQEDPSVRFQVKVAPLEFH